VKRDALVIVPTYNEHENLPLITRAILDASDRIEILVVDDNSPDGTGQLADELVAKEPRIHVLHRERKEGLGRAYLAGFGWALKHDYAFVLEMDADFSHDPRHLPELLSAAAHADLVLGSRYVEGGGTQNWGTLRRVVSKGGSLYARIALGVHIRDLTGGFKCFRRETLEQLDLASVRSEGYSFQIELTYRAVSLGLRVVEVPIVFVDRRVGKSKMSRRIFFEAAGMVLRLRMDKKGFLERTRGT
jgi:dolichol-phosphate mannosyltransferase